MNKKNRSVEVNGETLWISRSVAVGAFVVRNNNGNLELLIEKRGNGVDNSGKICVPCGYLDYDETLEMAVVRELKEETGLECNISKLKFMKILSSPSENRQNVCVHYFYEANNGEEINMDNAIGGEDNETVYVKWANIGKYLTNNKIYINYENINKYDWAFNHDDKLIEYLSNIYTIERNEEV